MTLTLDLLHRLLNERGTVSAYDAARALMCRPEEICALANDSWWDIEKLAGPTGFLYRMRPVVDTRKKMARGVKEHCDQGITRTTMWSPA